MTTSLRILIVEDTPADAELMVMRMVEEGFQPDWQRVQTEADYLAALETFPDLILADWSLPQFSGLRALHRMHERGLDIPFIIVSGSIGEESAIDALRQGAADYVLKDRPARLGQAVQRALEDHRLRVEKKQTAAALQASEEKHRLLFDHAGLGIGYFTLDGQLIAFNQAAAAHMGGNPEDYAGKTVVELYGEDIASVYLERIRNALYSPDNPVYEDFVPLPSGDKWFLSTYSKIRDATGKIAGVQIISNNITARKQAEEALRESERFAHSSLDGLSAHIAILDETGTILAVNNRWHAFAEANPPVTTNVNEGANYLAVCDQASGPLSEGAAEFAAGIRAVLSGKRDHFEMEYPCHSPKERRWFVGRVTRFPGDGPLRVVVAHENTTQLKLAELRLAEERNLLRTLIDNLPDRIYAKDVEGRFIIKNLADVRQMGVSSIDEVVGKTDFDYYPPELAGQYQADDLMVIQSGQSLIDREEPVITVDEIQGWMLTSKVPLRDSEGNVIGLVGIGHDITERRRAQEELREHNRRLSALNHLGEALAEMLTLPRIFQTVYQHVSQLIDCPCFGISLYDSETRTLRAAFMLSDGELLDSALFPPLSMDENTPLKGRARAILAQQAEIVKEMPAGPSAQTTIVGTPGDDRIAQSALYIPMVAEGQSIGLLEAQSYQKDAYRDADIALLGPVANQVGLAIQNARLFADLEAERALLEQRVIERTAQLNYAKEHIETILNSSSDLIILCFTDGRIDQVNPAFDIRFRCQPEEVYNQPLITLADPEHQSLLEKAFAAVVKSHRSQRLEMIAHCKSGESFEADVVLSPVVQNGDQLQGVLCSLRDITERNRMEGQLRQMLEYEIGLGEIKSRYISMAAHDLRNPLAAINTTVEVIENYYDRLSEEQRRAKFRSIHRSIKVMVDLLNDTLTLAQTGSGNLKFEPQPLDLIHFVQDLIGELDLATGNGHRIEFSTPSMDGTDYVDPKLLRHILGNLLSNALKYSTVDKPVRLDIQHGADEVIFLIQDQGIGIPQADQERLFEAFQRAKNVGNIPGTGLGLAIVKQSVDLHGGTINFNSEEGIGTTFTVVIPQSVSAGEQEI